MIVRIKTRVRGSQAMRNWGLIRSGATFEALVSSLVFFEDPLAALFGRAGPDGAQDVRSGDTRRVYQAKFHQDGSAQKAIADAKREAAKISRYRHADSPLRDLWRGVTAWQLVTNAEFNPSDRQRWEDEVVPLFNRLDLTATYWARAHLDALIDKHPELDRAFFQNETRALLSLSEARERLCAEEPLLRRSGEVGFFGRELEISGLWQFLSSEHLFQVIHGPGGVGKTRLLLEAGQAIAAGADWQVLWANIATMGSSAAWFNGIVRDRRTLLLVDEPLDQELLRVLAEQIGGRSGQTAQWKIIVAVRSPKDPVLRFLASPKMASRVTLSELRVLSEAAALMMCADLLRTGPMGHRPEGWRDAAARAISQRFGQHPVWMMLAVNVLETHGDLAAVPQTAAHLADFYLDEIVAPEGGTNDQVIALLRWVSLLRTVNRQDEGVMQLLQQEAGVRDASSLQAALATLVRRRALVQRGAEDRLVEVRLDVIRDHILLRWLAVDVGFGSSSVIASTSAVELMERVASRLLSGTFSSTDSAILLSAARTERLLSLSGNAVDLVGVLFRALKRSISTVSAGVGAVLAQALVHIAAFRPADTVALTRELRGAELPTEVNAGIFGSHTTSRDNVISELPWLVFHAATGALSLADRELVLTELCALTRLESEMSSHKGGAVRNDGKRAGALLERTVFGGPEFVDGFDHAAAVAGLELLDSLAITAPTDADKAVAKALLGAAISVERPQSWTENYTLYFRTLVLSQDSPAWGTRGALVSQMRQLAGAPQSPLASRVLMWELLAEGHSSALRAAHAVSITAAEQVRPVLLDDLLWALAVLRSRVVDFEELAAARPLWEWHLRFDDDEEFKHLSASLEECYVGNALAAEMEPLFGNDEGDPGSLAVSQKAESLAAGDGADAVIEFIDRASTYLGGDHELYRLFGLGHELGKHAPRSRSVRSAIAALLNGSSVTPRTDFAAVAASAWIAVERDQKGTSNAFSIVEQLLAKCGSDGQRINLISMIYGRASGIADTKLSIEERAMVLSLAPLFVAEGRAVSFVHAAAQICKSDWGAFAKAIDQFIPAVPVEQITAVVSAVVESVDRLTRDWRRSDIEASRWLLEHVLRLPDLDPPGSSVVWHLEEILKRLGRLPLTWLPGAMARRIDMEQRSSGARISAVGFRTRIGRYVEAVSQANAGDLEVKNAVAAIVDLASETGSVRHHLPRILNDIDPDGRIVPGVVAHRITVAELPEIWNLARLAKAYAVNTQPWRTIARPVLGVAARAADEDRRSLYHALTMKESRAWTSAVGEVPKIYIEEVAEAEARLDAEGDADFLPLWRWALKAAEARLHMEEELAKEQRGE
jgi:hypothetical protein